ncbi:hypothetical protein TrLO_g13897, partial [Triparma laevis f. longispina]
FEDTLSVRFPENFENFVLVLFLFVCQGLVHPWKIFVKKVSRTHIHGGYLRGLPSKPIWEDLLDYFDLLIESNSDDAAWDEMKPKDWHMGKKQGKKWLKSTKAEGFWRCSSGNGPIDQLRVSFPLEAEYADVVKHALKKEAMPKFSFKSEIVMTKNVLKVNEDSSVDEYFMTKTPIFWWNRDFMTRRYIQKNEYSFDVIRKSLTWDQEQGYALPSKLATKGGDNARRLKDRESVRRLIDPNTGDYYYENEITGDTQWDVPQGVEEVMATVISIYMITPSDLGGDYNQLVLDVREELEEFGKVESLIVPKKGGEGEGYVYCKYTYCWDAVKVKDKMISKEDLVNYKGDDWFASKLLEKKKRTSQRALLESEKSRLRSSFSENDRVWIEHRCTTGGNAGKSFFHQPSTGETTWERPEGEIRIGGRPR